MALDSMAKEGNTSTLELFLILVPELSDTCLRLVPVPRLKSVQVLELALGLPTLLLLLLPLLLLLLPALALTTISEEIYPSKAAMEENKKANGRREQIG